MKAKYADPWKVYMEHYDKLYWSPGKPDEQEKKVFYKFVKQSLAECSSKRKKVLVLGATPALRDELAKFDVEVTLLDASINIIKAMTELVFHKKKETFVEGDWLKMPFDDDSFDIVVGDLVLGNIDASNKKKFLGEINRVLKPDGFWVTRIFVYPEDWKVESTEDILKKFSKLSREYDRNTELFSYFIYNTYNPKTNEFDTSAILKKLEKFWDGEKYVYPDDEYVGGLLNRMHNMWKPFNKKWHSGTKKKVYSWISDFFNILDEEQTNHHIFGHCYFFIKCKAKTI